MRTALVYILVGGTSFWLPEILFAAVRHASAIDVVGGIVITALLPTVMLASYFTIRRRKPATEPRPSLALFMGIGVWVLGPLSMTFVATFAGTGFSKWHGVSDAVYLLLFSIFPIYTLMMSAYNGTILALILGSVLMVLFHFLLERGHWLVPPGLKQRLRLYLTHPTT